MDSGSRRLRQILGAVLIPACLYICRGEDSLSPSAPGLLSQPVLFFFFFCPLSNPVPACVNFFCMDLTTPQPPKFASVLWTLFCLPAGGMPLSRAVRRRLLLAPEALSHWVHGICFTWLSSYHTECLYHLAEHLSVRRSFCLIFREQSELHKVGLWLQSSI